MYPMYEPCRTPQVSVLERRRMKPFYITRVLFLRVCGTIIKWFSTYFSKPLAVLPSSKTLFPLSLSGGARPANPLLLKGIWTASYLHC